MIGVFYNSNSNRNILFQYEYLGFLYLFSLIFGIQPCKTKLYVKQPHKATASEAKPFAGVYCSRSRQL